MKIESITVSIFEMPGTTPYIDLVDAGKGDRVRWVLQHHSSRAEEVHVMHVRTDEGLEGVCTIGDARYATIRKEDLEQLRILVVGEDPLEREFLYDKLHIATRSIFARPGWFGGFDNCLWDIAGKVHGKPVAELIGPARTACPAYYNIRNPLGETAREMAIADTRVALEAGFSAVKDHHLNSMDENIELLSIVRETAGPDIALLHDAVQAGYTFEEAVHVGHALEELNYGWLEEPLPDRDQASLQRLCATLEVPVLALESLMHDITLSEQWLISKTTDLVRTNARHGTTGMLRLATLARKYSTTVEFNGPGGLFGLVHAHLCCGIENNTYYEYFPDGSRDEAGREIGLLNPAVPHGGSITYPEAPGWGAEWDWDFFEKKKVISL